MAEKLSLGVGCTHDAGRIVRRQAALASTTTSLSSTRSASGRLRSFSQAAITTVATQLPIKLPSACTMPINQSTERTSTSPIAGMLGTALSVAARITIDAVRALRGDERDRQNEQ